MSEHERGAYTPPTDEPLSFDARQPVRGARPFPFTLVISALVLVGLVVAIILFYRSGVRQAGEAPQTVGQPVGEIAAAAPPEAQPQDPAAGLQIYSESGETAPASPQFTAPPEQPQPRPQVPAVVVTPPAAAPTTPVTAGPALRPALPAAPVQTAQAPVTPPPAAQPKAAPMPAAPKSAPQPAAATAAPKAAGAAAVQIGAYSSQALADKGWSDAVAIASGGRGKSVERIEKGGSTLFRTAVTGFASRTEALAYCAKLKAAGKACFVR